MISYNSFYSPHIHKKMFDSIIPLKTSFRQSISFYIDFGCEITI